MALNDNSFKLSIDAETTILEHPIQMGARLVVSTEDLANEFFNSTKRDSGILPPVIRYISSDFLGFLLERPPTEVLIKFKDNIKYSAGMVTEFKLNLPWTCYGIRFLSNEYKNIACMSVYFRDNPIYSEDDELGAVPLPNIWSGGRICVNNLVDKGLSQLDSPDMNTIINCCINTFWTSEFNLDLTNNFHSKYLPANLEPDFTASNTKEWVLPVLKAWSELSQEVVLDTKWEPYMTVHQLMAQVDYSLVSESTNDDIDDGTVAVDWDALKPDTSRPFLEFIRTLALSAANK